MLGIWVCCIWDHTFCCQITFSECWHTVCQMANTHLLVTCVCIVCPGGAVFGTGHLIGSWSVTAQDYMLDWLGDVTSTVSSCQLSGAVCYPMNLYADLHTLYGSIRYMRCVIIAYSIISVLIFCVFFVYKFHKFPPPWQTRVRLFSYCVVYKITQIPEVSPCLSACLPLCLLICQIWSVLCVVTV